MKKLLALIFFSVLTSESIHAGCSINLMVQNNGINTISIRNKGFAASSAKVRGGTWRKLHKGFWMVGVDRVILTPNQERGTNYRAQFNCGAKRRYQFKINCNNTTSFVQYYPSATGWTTETNILVKLGDQCDHL